MRLPSPPLPHSPLPSVDVIRQHPADHTAEHLRHANRGFIRVIRVIVGFSIRVIRVIVAFSIRVIRVIRRQLGLFRVIYGYTGY